MKISRVWIGCFLCLIASFAFAGELTAQLDRNTVSQNETLQLVLTYTGGQVSDDPDLSSLETNFVVVGTSKSTQMTLINKKMSSQTQWMIDLVPRRVGDFQIPAFSIGSNQSTPLPVTVTKVATQSPVDKKKIFIEVSASPENPVVAGEIIYTVKLYYAANFNTGASLTDPVASNAIILHVGGDVSYGVMRNQQHYGVLERRYAIFPQSQGDLTIEPPQFSGDMFEGSMTAALALFSNGKTRAVHSIAQKLTLHISPTPVTSEGKRGIPAREVKLTEEWSTSKPITRTIRIFAKGTTGEQLPSLFSQQDTTDFNVYADPPQVSTTSDGVGMIGERIEKFTFIPKRSGQVTQAPVEIAWWNIAKKQWEVASLPPKIFSVTVSSAPYVGQASLQNTENSRENQFNRFWVWVAGVFFAVWIATCLMWWLSKRKPLSPVNLLIQDIEQGCRINNPKQTRRALFQLYALLSKPVHLKEMLKRLDDAVYAYDPERWDGRKFWELFSAIKNFKPKKQRKGKQKNYLPPLYPDHEQHT